jgi:two-component system, chemotaxis family, sensor kinase CheA
MRVSSSTIVRSVGDRAEALRLRLLATFRLEAADHLATIRSGLEALAADMRGPNAPAHLESLFRAMHTLKGAARSVGIIDFESACHRCETLLSNLIQTGAAVEPSVMRALEDTADLLAGFLTGTVSSEQLSRAAIAVGPKPAVAAVAAPAPDVSAPVLQMTAEAPKPTIRVATERLDQLVALTENLLSPKLAATERMRVAGQIVEQLREMRARTTANSDIHKELHAVEARARHLARALRADQKTLRTTVDELYEEMLRIRLMPATSMLEAFPRMVRDLCRDTGKEVAWHTSGEQLEIDRKVLELVKDPLIHLVRNAIDHGIESPDARAAAGKARQGKVAVTFAAAEGGRIAVEIADDGRGFAIDAIRDAVVRSHVLPADKVAAMSDADLTELAYNAGVTTSPVVTTISGHGRGLAIVRERIEQVGGRISTRSNAGVGTSIRLEFPASIVTYRALLLKAGGTSFLIPLEAIDRAFAISRDDLPAALATGHFVHGEQTFPFGSLADALGLARVTQEADERRELPCLLLHSGDRKGIVLVDEVLGEREVVIKDLRPPLRRVRNVLAAGLLGTGDLVLVLRPIDVLLSLISLPSERRETPVVSNPRKLRLLVVDDSITTRTMERNLFEAAGYRVSVAADGLDGWNVLQSEKVDVVVSDIDMPRMNGFELTSRIRAHPGLAELPIVLVTALEAREDKERGLRVGANAYVLKSGFDQTNLLDIVRRLA